MTTKFAHVLLDELIDLRAEVGVLSASLDDLVAEAKLTWTMMSAPSERRDTEH